MKKRVLITGASSDIGIEIAKELAKESSTLILTGNQNIEKIKTIIKELQKQNNELIIEIIKADLETEEEINKMISQIDSKYKGIDILINNAALTIDTTLEDKTASDFKRILNVNLIAPFILSKHYGKKMYEQKYGRIINISSTNAIDTEYVESMDYDASKAGLISITKNFAKAYAPYVNVNTVAPGWVNTRINNELDEDFKQKELDKILLQRFAKPHEIAKVVKFLVSDDANYINASIIRVDGGKE